MELFLEVFPEKLPIRKGIFLVHGLKESYLIASLCGATHFEKEVVEENVPKLSLQQQGNIKYFTKESFCQLYV